MSENICILVADDHPLFHEGVVHSLAAESDFTVVGQASSGEAALSMARDLHYITNIVQKLDVRSRVEAAMPAVRGSRGNTMK